MTAVAGETSSVSESVTIFVVDETCRAERRGAAHAAAPAAADRPSTGVTSAAGALRELLGCAWA